MYLREKRTVKELADLIAKYWAQYLRKKVSGLEVVEQACMDQGPVHEVFTGGMIEAIQERSRSLVTTENVNKFEKILADNLLNGVTVSANSGGTFRMVGMQELYAGREGLVFPYAISVDYHPDKQLFDPLETVFGDKAGSAAYFFPFKTTSHARFQVPSSPEEKVLCALTVREGYRSEEMEVLDDLSQRRLDNILNAEIVHKHGLEFIAREEESAEDLKYGYGKGPLWISNREVENLSHEAFIKVFENRLEGVKNSAL